MTYPEPCVVCGFSDRETIGVHVPKVGMVARHTVRICTVCLAAIREADSDSAALERQRRDCVYCQTAAANAAGAFAPLVVYTLEEMAAMGFKPVYSREGRLMEVVWQR